MTLGQMIDSGEIDQYLSGKGKQLAANHRAGIHDEELLMACEAETAAFKAESEEIEAMKQKPCCPSGCSSNARPYCHCQCCGITGKNLSLDGYCNACDGDQW
jgi:hypothetical protein